MALLTLVETALHLVEELLPATATEAAAVARVLAPVTDHDETEKHTAKMGGMGYTVTRTAKGREQLDGDIPYNKPLRLDGEREGDDKQTLVGERHTES